MRWKWAFIGIFFIGSSGAQDAVERIRVNQIGYYPHGPKIAVIVEPPTTQFSVIRDTTMEVVLTGMLSEPKVWPYSEERVALADFSELNASGTYRIQVEGIGESWPFEIRPFVHQRLAMACAKGFYYQRASMALEEKWAGPWKRNGGHPDTMVYIHPSAATIGRPAGSVIRSPRGWYDAGDYNKYIVNSGITMWTLLATYEHFPEYVKKLKLNIPESENNLPDLLDEVLWNLRWMLTMQDPDDGGVYHKLTSPNFCGFIMPDRDRDKRYVVQKSVTATLDFAAVMAQASRVFREFEETLPGLADSCLASAELAWEWALSNSNVYYIQSELNRQFDPDIYTGEYGDRNATDEFRWAAMELYLTTGDPVYFQTVNPLNQLTMGVPSWPNVSTCGIISLLTHPERLGPEVNFTTLKTAYLQFANTLVNSWMNSAYGVVMGVSQSDFVWGSNAVAANQALCLLVAYALTQDETYLHAALSNLDYCLGRNATGYSFVTGHGDKTPMHIHHRPSSADGVKDPVPGLIAGGPNPGQQDGVKYPSKLPAKSYVDNEGSYASNEIAINWNAPLVYMTFAIEAFMSENGLPQEETRVAHSLVHSHKTFQLIGNYPNPFNAQTRIQFALDQPSDVTLTILDTRGRKIAHLIDGKTFSPGIHEILFDAEGIASGVYFAKLETQGRNEIQKMLLLK